MFIRSVFIAVSLALGLAGATPAHVSTVQPLPANAAVFITGHGWGHGIGLAQYGAYGYALHGWKYDRIVTHYYPGTTLGSAPVSRVRVLLRPSAKHVSISSKLPFQVTDGKGDKHALDAGSYAFGPGLKLKVDGAKKASALAGPLVFTPGAAALALDGKGYRGSFQVTRVGSALQVVNVVGLDLYLRGVVPSEMPRSWAAEALKAQAVVARSYALAHLHRGGGFDLYPDTRSQVYGGIPAEAPSSNDAVAATAGTVALYKGHVADTLFFSTSGGRTASVQDVWPSSTPIPYLVSVPDPYDTLSPYHDWGPIPLTACKLARALHVPGKLIDVQTNAGLSGRVRTVVATGTGGAVTVSGSDVRSRYGLRSTWFRIGVLALSPPAAPAVYGVGAKLTGTARGVSSVELQQRGAAGWSTVGTLTPKDGIATATVKPKVTSSYRLAVGSISTGAAALAVAPLVVLHVPDDRSGFWGTVRPAAAGIAVQIQRQRGTAWRTVARLKTDAAGQYTVPATVASGVYRARVTGIHGLAPGSSAVLQVGS